MSFMLAMLCFVVQQDHFESKGLIYTKGKN